MGQKIGFFVDFLTKRSLICAKIVTFRSCPAYKMQNFLRKQSLDGLISSLFWSFSLSIRPKSRQFFPLGGRFLDRLPIYHSTLPPFFHFFRNLQLWHQNCFCAHLPALTFCPKPPIFGSFSFRFGSKKCPVNRDSAGSKSLLEVLNSSLFFRFLGKKAVFFPKFCDFSWAKKPRTPIKKSMWGSFLGIKAVKNAKMTAKKSIYTAF